MKKYKSPESFNISKTHPRFYKLFVIGFEKGKPEGLHLSVSCIRSFFNLMGHHVDYFGGGTEEEYEAAWWRIMRKSCDLFERFGDSSEEYKCKKCNRYRQWWRYFESDELNKCYVEGRGRIFKDDIMTCTICDGGYVSRFRKGCYKNILLSSHITNKRRLTDKQTEIVRQKLASQRINRTIERYKKRNENMTKEGKRQNDMMKALGTQLYL